MAKACDSCSIGTNIESVLARQEPQNNPLINSLYQTISKYFNGIIMTKIKDIGESSIYKANVSCLLSEYRYIVAICSIDYNREGFDIPLKELKWKSFQTRCSSVEQTGTCQEYKPVIDSNMNIKISKTGVQNGKTIYKCSFPIIIELLNKVTKPKSAYEQTLGMLDESAYSATGTLKTALDTYNCVLVVV